MSQKETGTGGDACLFLRRHRVGWQLAAPAQRPRVGGASGALGDGLMGDSTGGGD